ncbi:hypothetical protein J4558_26780 [Leptolyngbya sp. 15MV]|nr:hypothetical protein J4558_26780 [Leptolyngbya sp. 15MV]
MARSASPGPPRIATRAPGSAPSGAVSARAAAMKRSAGQTFGAQFAAGPSTSQGPPGSSAAARTSSSGAVQATGSGGGSRPSTAPMCTRRWPGRRPPWPTARRAAGTIQASAEARRSTTRSQRVKATWAHSRGQCRDRRCLVTRISRSSRGMRAKTPAAAGPQAMVKRASGCARRR